MEVFQFQAQKIRVAGLQDMPEGIDHRSLASIVLPDKRRHTRVEMNDEAWSQIAKLAEISDRQR
ncbi:hypothetical protein D3C76_1798300 [compost metagenome]